MLRTMPHIDPALDSTQTIAAEVSSECSGCKKDDIPKVGGRKAPEGLSETLRTKGS